MSSARKTLHELLIEGSTLDRALREGVRQALLRHKKLGESVAVWQDGKVVLLRPEEIPDERRDDTGPDSQAG